MNAVEIEQAVSDLVEAPFDPAEFPYQFLEAFGNKATTIKRLKAGSTNKSDLPGGVLQRNHIHLAVCEPGDVGDTLKALGDSPATKSHKAKYILATDGQTIEAENVVDGNTVACEYVELPDHFGFFLPLAGITTVQQITENAFDIRATSRLNKLYVELLKANPDWDSDARRQDLNHFFARLIFCFFAEDTGIFIGDGSTGQGLFTSTLSQMTAPDASNVHEVLAEIFRAMDTKPVDRQAGNFRPWADAFPYVNGGLFAGSVGGTDVPKFTKIARSYLLHIGSLDWTKINPDIFGSMIQAVADDEERGALGMHYTSVPNILKVLNPLFLDDLRDKLEQAGDGSDVGSKRKLLNLRNRLARIRVFDPACGSGNFLVIAYKEMREIEAEINQRRDEPDKRTEIPLTNFRGIELRHFACEIARLALVIAEFQCDAVHRGESLARAEFLPLDQRNWITHGNALRIDWLTVCPPTGTDAKMHADDLYETPLDQVEIDFENEGGETYICGNPPYFGTRNQTREQKDDLEAAISYEVDQWRSLDYVTGWLFKSAAFLNLAGGAAAFVTTSSICQGSQVPVLWSKMRKLGCEIFFAHTAFSWSNLAAHNAGVVVIILGIRRMCSGSREIYAASVDGGVESRTVSNINGYLVPAEDVFVEGQSSPISLLPMMDRGSAPVDGGNLIFEYGNYKSFIESSPDAIAFLRRAVGGSDFVKGGRRYTLYVEDETSVPSTLMQRFAGIASKVADFRRSSSKAATRRLADQPLKFAEDRFYESEAKIFVPQVLSEGRNYVVAGFFPGDVLTIAPHFEVSTKDLYVFATLSSRIHLIWINTVCGKLKTDYRYSNTLGWNTFPVPPLSHQNKTDLTRCAEDILLVREAYWPATIADMYNPARMSAEFPELLAAHERNDETLERIYIGRRFRNDTERLEKLFEMYTEMTADEKKEKVER